MPARMLCSGPDADNPVNRTWPRGPFEDNLNPMSRNGSGPPKPSGFVCSTCGQWHTGLALDWGFESPIYWEQTPEVERAERSFLNKDFCEIDHRDFFVRGVIPIPILDSDEQFMWGVWVSLSKPHFDRTISLWDKPEIINEPRYFGWLSNKIPIYPDTLNLKTSVFSKDVNHRPYIELEPTDHPLSIEQRTGITWKRVEEISALMLHA